MPWRSCDITVMCGQQETVVKQTVYFRYQMLVSKSLSWFDFFLVSGSPRELITRMIARTHLDVGEAWNHFVYEDTRTELQYSFRVRCDENYYGPGCNQLCRPRDDVFGHYVCSENGTKVCLEGWTGQYCQDGTCGLTLYLAVRFYAAYDVMEEIMSVIMGMWLCGVWSRYNAVKCEMMWHIALTEVRYWTQNKHPIAHGRAVGCLLRENRPWYHRTVLQNEPA